jgi:hypothetical protein
LNLVVLFLHVVCFDFWSSFPVELALTDNEFFRMKFTTSRIIALGFHAAVLFAGGIHAEDMIAVEAAAAATLTPKEPVKSEGCSLEDPKVLATPGGPSKRLKLGDRHLRLFVPKNYDPRTPAPLIIAFHDFNVSAPEFEKVTQLSNSAYNKDAIVVYPEASQDVRSPATTILFRYKVLTPPSRAAGCPTPTHPPTSTISISPKSC